MAHVADRRSFDDVRHLPAFHDLLPALARDLTALCAAGDAARAAAAAPPPPSLFDNGRAPAELSIADYLFRLCKYSNCSPWTFLVMRVYLDRYAASRRGGRAFVSSSTVHRLTLACFVVAAKLRDDVYYANSYYAMVGGVDLDALNELEGHLLTTLNWDTHVDVAELRQYGVAELPPPPPADAYAHVWAGAGAAPAPAKGEAKKAAPAPRAAEQCAPDVDDAGGPAADVGRRQPTDTRLGSLVPRSASSPPRSAARPRRTPAPPARTAAPAAPARTVRPRVCRGAGPSSLLMARR